MPIVNVKVIENVFTTQQKQEMITRITDALVAVEGENMRERGVRRIASVGKC